MHAIGSAFNCRFVSKPLSHQPHVSGRCCVAVFARAPRSRSLATQQQHTGKSSRSFCSALRSFCCLSRNVVLTRRLVCVHRPSSLSQRRVMAKFQSFPFKLLGTTTMYGGILLVLTNFERITSAVLSPFQGMVRGVHRQTADFIGVSPLLSTLRSLLATSFYWRLSPAFHASLASGYIFFLASLPCFPRFARFWLHFFIGVSPLLSALRSLLAAFFMPTIVLARSSSHGLCRPTNSNWPGLLRQRMAAAIRYPDSHRAQCVNELSYLSRSVGSA